MTLSGLIIKGTKGKIGTYCLSDTINPWKSDNTKKFEKRDGIFKAR